MPIEIRAIVAPKIGFASHQNSVPLLSDLEIVGSDETLSDLEVRLTADPPFLQPRTWRIDRLVPNTSIHVSDRDIALVAGLLSDLTEAITGTVSLSVMRGDEVLAACSFPVELLGHSEWGGAASMAELLAAFVMPNDPAVDRVLKASSDVLRRAGKKDSPDGYEAKSRSRIWELVSAVWSAVASFRISYALPPASFETNGQKVRLPSAVIENRVATCLDTALLSPHHSSRSG